MEETQTQERSIQLLDESAFLKLIEAAQVDVDALVVQLQALRASGDKEQAESRAEMAQDTLLGRKATDQALRILELRISWAEPNAPFSEDWQQEVLDVLGLSWEQKTTIDNISGGRLISAREAVRRIRLIRSLHPGVLCYDKTWGLGVVSKVDFYYAKVEIDFERKLGHQLSIAYAGEILKLVQDDHLLAWKHRRKEELKALVQSAPSDVVVMALKSFGPMPLAQLQSTLVPGIVAEPDWKRFWDQARKELRKSPRVVIPTARTQSLCLATDDKSRGEDWYVSLAKERDLEKLITRFEELADHKPTAMSDSEKATLQERYAFLLKGATQKQLGLTARALAAGHAIGLATPPGAMTGENFFDPQLIQQALRQMQVRASRTFMRYLEALDKERLRALLLQVMPHLEITAFNESISYLVDSGDEAACQTLYRRAADVRNPSLEMLHWLARNMDRIETWSLGTTFSWFSHILDALERECNGERLKAQNQLRERFGKADWLRESLAKVDADQRRQVVQRLRDAGGWEMLDRKSVLGQILKLYPELQEVMVEKEKKGEGISSRGPVTSRRTYEERRAQLQRIISLEIPKIAKDIAHARSYGDLRENFEYKAAKEAQTVLLRKRDELEQMLRRVAPSDFEGLPTDRAGLGTGVVIAYADGKTERYYIMGEWDTDQTLGIISCDSRMAKALEGKRKDEQVTVPTETGETSCRVVDVTALPEEIKAWAKAV